MNLVDFAQTKNLIQQKKDIESKFFDTIKGARLVHTAKNGQRPKIFNTVNKLAMGPPALYVTKNGLEEARPKSTRIKRVRGKNAFNKFGIVSRRQHTRKRFEKNYMRSFNQTQIGEFGSKNNDLAASNAVYRNKVSKPNYLKYKLMREILEKKSLEEIKTLEQKVLDIKNNTDNDFIVSTFSKNNNYGSKVILIEKNPESHNNWEQKLVYDESKIQIPPPREENKALNSPYERDTVRHIKRILDDRSNADVIKEDEDENSEKDHKNQNTLNNELYSSQTTKYLSKNMFKRSVGDSAVVINADLYEDRKSTIFQGN